LGQSVPKDLEGKVLIDIFTEEFNRTRTLNFTDEDHIDPATKDQILTAEEQAELASRLKSLGYVN
jgi:hypothetical protein